MATGTFWVNVETVVYRNGRYLMIERGSGVSFGVGWLTFPGGKVDWDEPLADALEQTARRELLEEVGIDLPGPWHYVESKTFDANGQPVLDVVLLARGGDTEPIIASPGEVAAVTWLTADEIRNDPRAQPWTQATLERAVHLVQRLGWA